MRSLALALPLLIGPAALGSVSPAALPEAPLLDRLEARWQSLWASPEAEPRVHLIEVIRLVPERPETRLIPVIRLAPPELEPH